MYFGMLISVMNLFYHKNCLLIFLFESSQVFGTGKISEIQYRLKGSHPVNKDHLNMISLHITIATT